MEQAPTVEAIIRVEDLHRDFKMGREIVHALDGVTISVPRGDFLGVSGASGSGKSTLMYACGGLDRPTSGHIWVDGQDLAAMDEDGLADYRQSKIGFIFQMFNLIPTMTALDNVEFPLLFSNMKISERRQRAKHLLEVVGLGDRMNHKPTELSGGQQQRVAVARSLVNDPAIVLADEPTGNLDSRSGAEVMALLQRLNQEGRTIMVVSHDLNIISQATHSIRLHDGQIVETR